ncbi:hypothetical protein SAMN05518854_10710 [Variovorax sp. YR266]|uniref:hypothetical protein n=1 Tax=Variovorax TaxID=34072 RepID=UPI000894BA08|nr:MULTISPECIES: hypothetical protein [Variovorax]MDQ0081835.1 hypothetical protein [Variovorax boronicumulans]SDZ50984.1 hypothetical protein SAMN05518854_10710 [Variovorax sp. YR266]
MLDLYFVEPACRHLPKDPRGLEHAGSVDLDVHRSLAALFDRCIQKGADLKYFEDSLLRGEQVVAMLEIFTANAPETGAQRGQIAAFKSMHAILTRAKAQGMGLAAFCD